MQPHLHNLIKNCSSSLIIASPYIKKSAVDWLVATKPPCLKTISILTNLSLQNILSKSLETTALHQILESFPIASIVSLQHLHAKVFVADEKVALVTSANFTNGGLWTNYEYGIFIRQRAVVADIVRDMASYSALGGIVSPELLQRIDDEIRKLTSMQKQTESNSATRALRHQIRQSQTELQNVLLAYRLAKGQTINSLFSNTILLVLQKHPEGITTPQIHDEIKSIHPDICDDSIDRVINGQHFGKQWKHYVRRAQESLKEKGVVASESGIWRLREHV